MGIDGFDFRDTAELYTCVTRRGGRRAMVYRRFDTSAKAIRYSMEELPDTRLSGTILEVDGVRYRHTEIRKLYDSSAYPLPRRNSGPGSA
jgi:hypothetical protein